MHPVERGDISCLRIIADLLRNGYLVLQPISDRHRFDLVIFKNDEYNRVQCKSGTKRDGSIVFSTCSRNIFGRRSYKGQIEFFAVYCHDIEKSYLIPVEEVGFNQGSLRIDPPKNNQQKKVRYAKEYEI